MEEQIEDITYTPYVQWREWIDVLSQYHVGVHLMPTIAAGTFAMNCAFHGIPVIGYKLKNYLISIQLQVNILLNII